MTLSPNPVATPVNNSFCPSPLPACQVTVSANQTVLYYFARLVGVSQGTLNVTSTATGGAITTLAPPSGTSNLMPIGIDYNSVFSNNNTVAPIVFKFAAGPGNWGWFGLGGTGESNVRANIASGYGGTLNVGDTVSTETGAGTNSFKDMQKDRSGCAGTATDHPPNSPCAVTVLLVDWSACGSGCTGHTGLPIKGFGEVWIDSVDPKNQTITATWITQAVSGGSFGGGGGLKDGAVAVKLLQ